MPEEKPHALLRLITVAGAIAAAIFTGWWFAQPTRLPDTTEGDAVGERPLSEVALELAAESEELELLYDDEVTFADVPTPEQLVWLENALLAQREFVRVSDTGESDAVDRIRALEVKLAGARALVLHTESARLASLAADQLATGDRVTAVASLREALRLQQEIDAMADASEYRDAVRAATLQARIAEIETAPLVADVSRLENEARQALEGGRVVEAGQLFQQAADAQARLIDEHPHLAASGSQTLQRIENELSSLGAATLAAQRDELVVEAARRSDAGLHRDAAGLFERAAELQRQINVLFPASRLASEALVAQFEKSKDAAAARADAVPVR